MDDPTPEDLAVGVLVTIGSVAVVVIGAGWYPNLEPGTWAQWVWGLGTLLAVLVALFGDRIRGRMFGPKLDVTVSTEPPDCVRVATSYKLDSDSRFLGSDIGTVDSVYVRMKVQNTGRSAARDVQVFAESVMVRVPGEGWQPVRMFPSMNLPWSDLPPGVDPKLRMFFPGLGPTMSKHCDLGRIAYPRNRHLLGDRKDDLDQENNAFSFETLVKAVSDPTTSRSRQRSSDGETDRACRPGRMEPRQSCRDAGDQSRALNPSHER